MMLRNVWLRLAAACLGQDVFLCGVTRVWSHDLIHGSGFKQGARSLERTTTLAYAAANALDKDQGVIYERRAP